MTLLDRLRPIPGPPPISAAIAACILIAVAVALALANVDAAGDGDAMTAARLGRCEASFAGGRCGTSVHAMRRCLTSHESELCSAVSAFVGDASKLRLGRQARLTRVLRSLRRKSAVSARMAAALPVLRKPQTGTEADQLASVRRLIFAEPSGVLLRKAFAATKVDLARARRFYYDAASGAAQYVAPGTEGAFCTIGVNGTQVSEMGCSRIGPGVEAHGTMRMTVMKGGYELSGLLPRGARRFRVVSSKHDVKEGVANRWGGFRFAGKGIAAKLEAEMRDGRWRVIEDQPFPPPPPRGRKLEGHTSSSGR